MDCKVTTNARMLHFANNYYKVKLCSITVLWEAWGTVGYSGLQ